MEPVRCPFCVQGNEFRRMVDLTGGIGRMFYCSACRHLIRTGEPEFQCLCRGCRSLIRPLPQPQEIAGVGGRSRTRR